MNILYRNRLLITMALWLVILGGFACWIEMDTRREEKALALTTANAFFQLNQVSRQWNSSHGGVYVPVTPETPPNPYLPEQLRELTTDSGMRLARINPSYMTRQMADLAAKRGESIHFHITSLKPIRPENKPADWEVKWLESFEQGAKEQGDFFEDGQTTWFRYMAPLNVGPECLKCHAHQGYKEGDIRGGISVSLPYSTHSHLRILGGFGSAAIIGLICIFAVGTIFERKQRLFDATFNSPIPTCLTGKDYTILMANEAYWAEFGPLPDRQKSIKCHEHRPGKACHTENCPLTKIINGTNKYICEPSKEKDGPPQHFIVTAKPLLDAKGEVSGIVESFQDITERKQLESEREHLIEELKKSLEQVKLLSGFIPICASCKQVRDDQGFWTQVEAYISQHSEAKFSHGLCPDCVRKLYPDICDQVLAAVGHDTSAPDKSTAQQGADVSKPAV